MSGAIVLDSVIEVRVTKPYGESTVAKILELVENASQKRRQLKSSSPNLRKSTRRSWSEQRYYWQLSHRYFWDSHLANGSIGH